MNKQQGSTGLIVTIVVLALTVLVVGGIALWPTLFPAKSSESTKDQSESQQDLPAEEEEAVEENTPPIDGGSDEPTVDPATISTINVEPLGVVVTYGKSLPGFEFEGKRTSAGTLYVEFSSPRLVGTKCTNDTGLFASIIKNPSETESQTTVSKTKKLGDDTFGLSLAGENCTSNLELLKEFQTSFSGNFSALRNI